MMTLNREKEGKPSEILLCRGLAYFVAISSAGPSAAWQLSPTIAPTLILSPSKDLPRVWTLTQFSSESDYIVVGNAIGVMWVFRYNCPDWSWHKQI